MCPADWSRAPRWQAYDMALAHRHGFSARDIHVHHSFQTFEQRSEARRAFEALDDPSNIAILECERKQRSGEGPEHVGIPWATSAPAPSQLISPATRSPATRNVPLLAPRPPPTSGNAGVEEGKLQVTSSAAHLCRSHTSMFRCHALFARQSFKNERPTMLTTNRLLVRLHATMVFDSHHIDTFLQPLHRRPSSTPSMSGLPSSAVVM